MDDWTTHKAELMKNPEIRAAYDALAPEYELATQIIRLRLSQQLTQSQLAEKAGLKQAAIARLEGGRGNPTYETLYRVSKALGKTVHIG